MKLLGNYLSPYTRRVAVSLHLLGLDFELEEVFIFQEPDRVRAHNPLARIPTLLLDDGEALVESHAILDAIDQMVPPDRALVPREGKSRREVMRVAALANAMAEKAQWMFYERRFRPATKVHEPWLAHNRAQVIAGLQWLDERARSANGEWLARTASMGQADVSAAVATSFVDTVLADVEVSALAPQLWAFRERCETLPAFVSTPIPALPA